MSYLQKNSFTLYALLIICLLSGCLSKKRGAAPVLRNSKQFKHGSTILTDISGTAGLYTGTGNLLADYADLLEVNVNELNNEYLYTFITDWMGTPYAYGGTTKKGIDCSGFAGLLMSEVYGKVLPRSSEEQAGAVKRKYEKQLKEGDLVFFSFGSARINHVGIYLHNGRFAHASTSKGVIISNLKDTWYYKAFKRAGSVR